MLLSANVERVSVSRMRDIFLKDGLEFVQFPPKGDKASIFHKLKYKSLDKKTGKLQNDEFPVRIDMLSSLQATREDYHGRR